MSIAKVQNRKLFSGTATNVVADDGIALRWYEKVLLGTIIFEVPLQIDKLLMYREFDGELGAVAGVNVSIGTFALIGLYIVWLIRKVDVMTKPVSNRVYGFPLLIYLAAVFISLATADVQILAVFDLLLLIQGYMLFYYVANRVRTIPDLKWMLIMLCSTVIFQSLLIFVTGYFAESLYDGKRVYFGPLSIEVGDEGRPGGSLHSPTLAGSYLALLWLPALAMLMTPVKGLFRWVATATVVLGAMAILMTQTRGAILTTGLGTIAVTGFCLARGWFPVRLLVVGLLVAAAGFVPLLGVIKNRIGGDDRGSAEARIHLSEIAWEVIQDKPIFGVGAGNCHLAGLRYANHAEYRSLWYFTVHCKYLLVWVETGLIGLIAFFVLLGSGIRNSISVWMTRNRLLAPLGLGLAVAIMGNMVHMIVDIFNSRPQVFSLWTLLGLAAAMRVIALEQPASDESPEVSHG